MGASCTAVIGLRQLRTYYAVYAGQLKPGKYELIGRKGQN